MFLFSCAAISINTQIHSRSNESFFMYCCLAAKRLTDFLRRRTHESNAVPINFRFDSQRILKAGKSSRSLRLYKNRCLYGEFLGVYSLVGAKKLNYENTV